MRQSVGAHFPRVSRKQSIKAILHRIAVGFEAPHSVLVRKQRRPDTVGGFLPDFKIFQQSVTGCTTV